MLRTAYSQTCCDSIQKHTAIDALTDLKTSEQDSKLCDSLNNVLMDNLKVADQQFSTLQTGCDTEIAIHVKIEANNQKKIGSLEKRNSKLQNRVYLYGVIIIVESVSIYVMTFKR